MRIGVLGGGGDMGSRAVAVLADREEVDEVVVLDRDEQRAGLLEARHERVRAQRVDATDHTQLVAALRGLDAVASALGPFYRFERALATAAIEAGVGYVSICDDHDAAADVLTLDEAAAAAGVTVLTGLGWTPGLTNLAARRLHDELGGLEAVRVFWAGAAADSSGHAVVLHTLHAFDGHVPAIRDGVVVQQRAGRGREPVSFPPPVGRVDTCYLGHPEPVTLPRFLPGLRRVDLKGGLTEGMLNSLARGLAAVGLTSTHQRRQQVARTIEPLLPRLERLLPSVPMSAWRVDGAAGGRRGGYWGVGHMADLTGVPLAVGTLLLARGEIDRPGVVAPEADGIPHERLWELLEPYGVRADPVGWT